MYIHILRHGEAEARSFGDSTRKLTSRGQQEVENVGHQFADRKITLDRVFVSPFTRARQTAAHFLEIVQPGIKQEISEFLTPEHRAHEVLTVLQGMEGSHVLLVSHNPLVSELFALLTEGDLCERHILGTSELVSIESTIVGPGTGTLQFMLKP